MKKIPKARLHVRSRKSQAGFDVDYLMTKPLEGSFALMQAGEVVFQPAWGYPEGGYLGVMSTRKPLQQGVVDALGVLRVYRNGETSGQIHRIMSALDGLEGLITLVRAAHDSRASWRDRLLGYIAMGPWMTLLGNHLKIAPECLRDEARALAGVSESGVLGPRPVWPELMGNELEDMLVDDEEDAALLKLAKDLAKAKGPAKAVAKRPKRRTKRVKVTEALVGKEAASTVRDAGVKARVGHSGRK